jgi:hypothetical protein
MAEWTTPEIQAVVRKILSLSVVDPSFRALALKDTPAAFAKFDPRPLPSGFKLTFVDNSGSEQILVLPPAVQTIQGIQELEEDELQMVAGGVVASGGDTTVTIAHRF